MATPTKALRTAASRGQAAKRQRPAKVSADKRRRLLAEYKAIRHTLSPEERRQLEAIIQRT